MSLGTWAGTELFPVPVGVGCKPHPAHTSASPVQMMQTNIPGVFAAGDAVTFPLALRNNKKVNVPHWQMAHMHGRYFSAPSLCSTKLFLEKELFPQAQGISKPTTASRETEEL